MKKIFVLLCLLLFLSACAPGGTDNASRDNPSETPFAENPAAEGISNIYAPAHPLTVEETIQQFFEQQYNAYAALQYIDISSLLDMNQNRLHNSLIWLESLIQRRKLISENQFCYVDTIKHPYRITYQEKAEDGRMEFWNRRGIVSEDDVVVHFTITGEAGQAYPPFLAVNGQHTMRLRQIDGVWKITFHYYPGSSRLRTQTPLVLLSEQKMLADLREEFKAASASTSSTDINIPAAAFRYNSARAVEYAKTHIASPNPDFYDINDWTGNCANFTSQSLWYGFGEKMTSKWYAGQGGGSPPWENVQAFWNYVASPSNPQAPGLHGEIVDTIWGLEPGGIVQSRSGRFRNTNEEYNHNLLLVDKSTLLLAQNTPDCFIYYSDLADTDTRFFNPLYLIK